jgi:hypothetical protein
MRNRRYYRDICEDFLRIDIRRLLTRPDAPTWQYPTGAIAISINGGSAHLIHDGLDYFVVVERTRCNYGGSRPWFLCPGCGDRRAVLFGHPRGGHLGCRRCLKLLFLTECDDAFDRAIHKLRKIELRVCEPSTEIVGTAPVADKPKGQHWRTYDLQVTKLINARIALCRLWSAEQAGS